MGEGGKDGEEWKCNEANVKQGGFADTSNKWGREGSADCGRVVIEETGVSKSRRCRGGVCY